MVSWFIFPALLAADPCVCKQELVGTREIIAEARRFWRPALAVDPTTGNYLIAWFQEDQNTVGSIVVQIRSSANLQIAEITLDIGNIRDAPTIPFVDLQVAFNSTRREFLVVWQHEFQILAKPFELRAALISTGGVLKSTFRLKSSVDYIQAKNLIYNPVINEYLLSFLTDRIDPVTHLGIDTFFLQRLTSRGRLAAGPILVEELHDVQSVSYAKVSHDPEADIYLLSWIVTPGSNTEVRAQPFSAQLVPLSASRRIESDSVSSLGKLELLFSGFQHSFVAFWAGDVLKARKVLPSLRVGKIRFLSPADEILDLNIQFNPLTGGFLLTILQEDEGVSLTHLNPKFSPLKENIAVTCQNSVEFTAAVFNPVTKEFLIVWDKESGSVSAILSRRIYAVPRPGNCFQ